MFNDYYFWFSQPSTVLNNYDWAAGYIFAGLVVLSVIIWITNKYVVKHDVLKKYFGRIANAIFWVGVVGLIWFAFRYQAIPVFSKRAWAGGIMILGILWIGYVKVTFFKNFSTEKKEYDYNLVKNKYIK